MGIWKNESSKTKNMAKYSGEQESIGINLIGVGTLIEGNVSSNGDIRIDGTLNGNLLVKGKVVIGETGNVRGDIYCRNADLSGTFQGKLFVSELLTLKATSNISGEIVTNRLSIEPNANFSGTCRMDETALNDVREKMEQQAS